jgi:hypothetical protein
VIATAITLPLIVVLALVIGAVRDGGGSSHTTGGALSEISEPAPPNVTAQAKPCTALLEALSPLVKLKTLDQRVVKTDPPTPYVVAWGDPAIVISCGVDKPAGVKPGSDSQFFSINGPAGAFYDVEQAKDGTFTFTTVDRAAYVSITFPKPYTPATYIGILNPLILKAMPKAVCSTSDTELDTAKLCANRKD